MSMTREEYLEKKREYYKANKHKWVQYAKEHRDELNAKSRERRLKNIEKYREREKEWRIKNSDKNKEYQRRYRAKAGYKEKRREYYESHKEDYYRRARDSRANHPDARRCHSIINKAISLGKIAKQPCEVCGDKSAQAHHDDYNKPLEVRWLCKKCHAKWHAEHTPIRANYRKKCAQCGGDFTYTHRSQKFCSEVCRRKWGKTKAHEYYLTHIDKWKNNC